MLSVSKEGVLLKVKVQPRSSRNKIVGEQDGILKIALNSPPVDGEANAACIELLAKTLGLKKAQIEIKIGEKSRNKTILLKSTNLTQIEDKIREILK